MLMKLNKTEEFIINVFTMELKNTSKRPNHLKPNSGLSVLKNNETYTF